MFGLKLFKRSHRQVAVPVRLPAPVASSLPPTVSRLTGPPPPPPPEAFASTFVPATQGPDLASVPPAAFGDPDPFLTPLASTGFASDPLQAELVQDPQPGPATPARVRFFYEDGSVSEGDAGESERLGYLANNLLEASRDDQS